MPSLSMKCAPGRLIGWQVLAVLAGALFATSVAPHVVVAQGTAKAKPREAGDGGGLQKRIEQLEEQLVDMQVTIGTLESLARSGGAARGGAGPVTGGGGGLGASDAARLEGMETQIRALTSEVQRLTNQVRQLGGSNDRGDIGAGGPSYAERAAPQPPVTTSVPSSFGSTTVTQGGDPIGSLIDAQPTLGAASAAAPGTQVAALPPVESNAGAKQDYETAYGHLLRQDYGAAEAAFEEFLKSHPSDELAGNAQYWLGETHFVRGNYKSAAGAFLKGYQTYAKSNKAPDSLLKLAMSLDRLGQKDAACSSFSELVSKFPEAAGHVKEKAAAEQRRLKCR